MYTGIMLIKDNAKAILLYIVLLLLTFLLVAGTWYFGIDGVLFYCTDRLLIVDMIPPFIHGPEYGDHFIAPAVIVYGMWILAIAAIFLLPWLVVRGITKPQRSAVEVIQGLKR